MDNIEQGQIVFDTESGFSMEEQQEILDRINSLSLEKSMVPEGNVLKSEAKKRGILFPLLLNIAALLFLAGGFVLLWFFFSSTDHDIRTSDVVLSLDDQRLLREIRLETNRLLNEKESQINIILLNLEDIEIEYRQLEMSVETLSDEQRARAEYLLNLQDEYNVTLTQLRTEQTEIIEHARQREMQLRAEAESRVRTLTLELEQSGVELSAAMEEMARLSSLQERASVAETQNIALQYRIDELTQRITAFNPGGEEYERIVSPLRTEANTLRGELQLTETARTASETARTVLQGQVLSLTADRDRLQQELADLRADIRVILGGDQTQNLQEDGD